MSSACQWASRAGMHVTKEYWEVLSTSGYMKIKKALMFKSYVV